MENFPDDCWAKIFSHVNEDSDLESISLVCKRFLSISNSSRLAISLTNTKIKVIQQVLRRFSYLKKMKISSGKELNEAVCVILRSGLDIEELDLSFFGKRHPILCLENLGSNLKTLKLKNCRITNSYLVTIANSFSLIEELRFRCCDHVHQDAATMDEGIDYLFSKLKNLRKIELDFDSYLVSDKSLVSLSSNCVFLQNVALCSSAVTKDGISFLFNNCRHLNSFALIGGVIRPFGREGFSNISKNFQTLKFLGVYDMSDDFLCSIREARINLTQLTLDCCPHEKYTYAGIYKLLHWYRTLTYLDIRGAGFLTNQELEILCQFFSYLKVLKLHECPLLSNPAFVMLTQKCPRLHHLELCSTSLGDGEELPNPNSLVKNFNLKYMDLSCNSYLRSANVKKMLSICPNVDKLLLSQCFQDNFHYLNVAYVLECNREFVNLDLSQCCFLKFAKSDVEIFRLEKLNLNSSGINDDLLAIFGRVCPRLIRLNLGNCSNVTEKGVKQILRSCRRLRIVGLSDTEEKRLRIKGIA